ncbi:hypothetical protein B5C34_07565 [Pacificimonas flava]|uniref:Uncharacterized protein n=2 Tax=Pacificimonas TaxID=1960290 RepID=A0A219B4Q0_9SPHN|nr:MULTISPECIES: hypothetical protein [Pacificimonas]MBZ6379482.1 hypothetical protein [Pacificimonas aurantium]OWV33327.1 hypothetical protein B5C34_07565 [Pacificimonas flava]
MTFDLNLFLIYALPGFLIGLLLGYLLFNGSRARATLREKLGEREAALRVAEERQQTLEQDVAMARDQVKPLADEVDKLRAETSRLKARATKTAEPSSEPVAAAAAVPAPPPSAPADGPRAFQPDGKLPTFLPERPAEPDDLSLLKGVGPKLEQTFHDVGVWYFAQIAGWTDEELAEVDAKLGNFKGRIARDKLREQAELLAAGRVTEYEARFGKLGPAK